MTQNEFKAYTDERNRQREALSKEKGEAYASQGDRFDNFKARAALLGMTPMQVALCDMSKHVHRLVRFAKGIDRDTDGFASRADDVIIYMQLIDGMREEIENA